MRHRLLYHIVWVTQRRAPLIDLPAATFIARVVRARAREHRAVVLELGIVSTHVHLLLRGHPLTDLPKMIGRMKGVTSRLAKTEAIAPITWADGYDIESVSPAEEEKLRHYLRAQPYRHPAEAIAGWRGDRFALPMTRV